MIYSSNNKLKSIKLIPPFLVVYLSRDYLLFFFKEHLRLAYLLILSQLFFKKISNPLPLPLSFLILKIVNALNNNYPIC